ncbi:creatininase family protein [Caldivirga maquilingensis]|uniref:Creatininase n=1 Tax=Caldivirga maquilingensis (strain ATCC 700844 / DSM 13496 / JCM 10307 / IC-167) TaxID=397948 RepID=A8MA36_CALMQ|nr:creatininase family protein [Caldivirga maquilingensis]ABW00968.1 Creatininase [Caldivirga maquilingensis IC-167]
MRWWELTWPDFEKVDKTIAILPTGIVEAHGPHLPLGTDALMATYIAEEAARRTNALLLPTVWYGNTYVLDKFPGTISISNEVLYMLYREIFREVVRNGVKYLVVVNGHGGNVDALSMASKDVAKETNLVIILVNWWIDLGREARRKVLETPEGHAAEDETSEVWAAYPHLVKWIPRDGSADEWVEVKFRVYGKDAYALEYTKAVQGYPSRASVEKGKVILESAINELTQLINDLRSGKLPISKVK